MRRSAASDKQLQIRSPPSSNTSPMSSRKPRNDKNPVRTRRPAGRGRQRRDHLAGRKAPGPRDSASVLFARTGLPAPRQLSRLLGGGRGPPPTSRLLQAHADRPHQSILSQP